MVYNNNLFALYVLWTSFDRSLSKRFFVFPPCLPIFFIRLYSQLTENGASKVHINTDYSGTLNGVRWMAAQRNCCCKFEWILWRFILAIYFFLLGKHIKEMAELKVRAKKSSLAMKNREPNNAHIQKYLYKYP